VDLKQAETGVDDDLANTNEVDVNAGLTYNS
jgi:hypothetical protein